MPATFPKGVSIVVCTYNGAERLHSCLGSLLAQERGDDFNIELIIVNNRSTDATEDYLRTFYESYSGELTIVLIDEPNPGKSYAAERGYDQASFETIITCDDDNLLAPDFARTAFEILSSHSQVGIIGAKAIPSLIAAPPKWFDKFHRSYAVGDQYKKAGVVDKKGAMVWGAGMVMRREYWQLLRTNGFSFITGKDVAKAVGEDSELSLLAPIAGYQIYYSPALVLQHQISPARLQWKTFLTMCENFGRTEPFLAYYEYLQATQGDAKLPIEFYKSWRQHIRRQILSLIVQTKGRCLIKGALPEGNKYAALMKRYAAAAKQMKHREKIVAQFSEIHQIVKAVLTKHHTAEAVKI